MTDCIQTITPFSVQSEDDFDFTGFMEKIPIELKSCLRPETTCFVPKHLHFQEDKPAKTILDLHVKYWENNWKNWKNDNIQSVYVSVVFDYLFKSWGVGTGSIYSYTNLTPDMVFYHETYGENGVYVSVSILTNSVYMGFWVYNTEQHQTNTDTIQLYFDEEHQLYIHQNI
jgi:hypothetical protein